MCDRWDIGGLSTNIHFQTGRPTIFVYDGHPGGVGITERGFEAFEGWVADTARMIAGCPCEHGCPSCVQSPKCGNLNDMLDKAAALRLLQAMLARPLGPASYGFSTIVSAGAFSSSQARSFAVKPACPCRRAGSDDPVESLRLPEQPERMGQRAALLDPRVDRHAGPERRALDGLQQRHRDRDLLGERRLLGVAKRDEQEVGGDERRVLGAARSGSPRRARSGRACRP